MSKEILCAYGVDVDAVGGWLGSYGGADSPNDISRGIFAGEVGAPRLLELFRRFDLKTTWFIPGHSVETFPEQMQMVVEAGHETGLHGYSHDVVIRLLCRERAASRLRVESQLLGAGVRDAEASGRQPGPKPAGGPEFCNFFDKVVVRGKEK